jgi:tetratricopeptide (TPR) repeat protein
MAQRGYLATIQRLILSPEFERVALRPMAAGRTLRHGAESGLAAEHAAALSTILGVADQVPKNWAQEMALALGSPELLAALRRIPVSRGQEEQRTYVFDTLARLAEEARKPPPVRVFVDYRDERRVVVFCRNLPKNRQLRVDVSVNGPQELSFSAIARPVTDARSEAVFSLPVPTLAPHAWSGTAICHFHDPRDPHANLPACAPLPIRMTMSSAVLEKVQAAAVAELKRVQYLLDGGRRREALSLLARIQQDTPTIAEAQVLAASAAAVAGELDQAVAMVELLPGKPAADELRARLYIRTGRIGEASALLDQLAPMDGLRGRALALLAEACRGVPSGDGAQALMPAVVLREAALRLLVRPAQSAAAFAVALCAADGVPDREALARDVVAALALCFAPGAGIAELIREVDQHGLLPLSRFVADNEVRKLGYLLLPALCELAPERIAHADLLLAISRTLDAAGRTQEALRFAEEAAWLGKESFDAHIVAAQLNQRLRAPDAAIQQLEAALRLKPGDARTMERLLSLEIEAKKLDPLRSSERHDALLAQSTEHAQAALLKAPRDPATRLDYARFAALAERFDEARGILRGLADDNPEWPAPVLLLMRIAQQLDQHEDVLQLFARLPPQEVDDRAVMWAAKSHRGLGAVTQAHDLLAARLDRGGAPLRREYVRNLFFEGRFEEALQAANRMLDGEDRHDLELRFLAAAACLELRQNEMAYFHTAWIQLHGGSKLFPLEMPLFLYAVMQRTGDPSGALSQLDPMFGRVGAQRIRLDTRLGSAAFDQLCPTGVYPENPGPHAPLFQGPKVSVIMTTFNVENYVHTAVRSILQQTYRNLELIIIDDASTDRTPAILAELERSDPRVKIILKSTNDGTYVSKNMGLLQSQGEFVAFQDSDDWSHPDRLACSIGVLMRNPSVVALTTDWLRMTTDGDIVIKAGGQISHVCCISLVARRAPMLNQVGFFDSVRIAADLELIQRLSLAFGSKAVPRLRWPLLLGRARSDSLTASEEFGISRTGFTEPRQLYHRYADEFHTRIAAGASPYIPFPLRRRLFDAPAIILPTRDAA